MEIKVNNILTIKTLFGFLRLILPSSSDPKFRHQYQLHFPKPVYYQNSVFIRQ
jgi:hypothetical protein